MVSTFFNHELKAFWRSENTGKSVAVKAVMGVLIFILLLYVVIFGVFLDLILAKYFRRMVLSEFDPEENL